MSKFVPATDFLDTLREALAEFDRRLLAVEEKLDRITITDDELLEHFEPNGDVLRESQRMNAGPPTWPDTEHFLAPPMPWWARSPKVG